ncbi:MAG: hypothetical protein ABSF64_10000 [Bryobacteraceae bacterium]|jgi:hypothetical protein
MPELNEDLWPSDLGIASIVTPAAIIRAQAALLAEKTKGILEAVVETSSIGPNIRHSFVIKVPALGNYRYALFSVHHPVELYPVVIEGATPSRLEDEDALREWLRRMFASDATKRIIASLYSQASGL